MGNGSIIVDDAVETLELDFSALTEATALQKDASLLAAVALGEFIQAIGSFAAAPTGPQNGGGGFGLPPFPPGSGGSGGGSKKKSDTQTTDGSIPTEDEPYTEEGTDPSAGTYTIPGKKPTVYSAPIPLEDVPFADEGINPSAGTYTIPRRNYGAQPASNQKQTVNLNVSMNVDNRKLGEVMTKDALEF